MAAMSSVFGGLALVRVLRPRAIDVQVLHLLAAATGRG